MTPATAFLLSLDRAQRFLLPHRLDTPVTLPTVGEAASGAQSERTYRARQNPFCACGAAKKMNREDCHLCAQRRRRQADQVWRAANGYRTWRQVRLARHQERRSA